MNWSDLLEHIDLACLYQTLWSVTDGNNFACRVSNAYPANVDVQHGQVKEVRSCSMSGHVHADKLTGDLKNVRLVSSSSHQRHCN